MTEKEILEGNKLIAEFMGWKMLPVKDNIFGQTAYYFNDELRFIEEDKYLPHHLAALGYDNKWENLMPVVEKIESINYNVTILRKSCEIKSYPFNVKIENDITTHTHCRYEGYCESNDDTRTKISAVWQAVVQFIQYYNTQQTS